MVRLIYFILFLCALTFAHDIQCPNLMDRFDWQKSIIPDKNTYWKSTPPQVNESVPVQVIVVMTPTAIGKISLQEQSIEVQYVLIAIWQDCRLNISSGQYDKISILASEVAREIWVPTFEYRNCIGMEPIIFDERIHSIFVVQNKTSPHPRLGYYSRRMVNLHCSFDLSGYPMDTQQCKLQIQAGAPTTVMVLNAIETGKNLSDLKKELVPPQYKLKTMTLRKCPENYSWAVDFSCVELHIEFSRQVTFHMGVTFLPSILIVILTWISFWMDPDAAAPRVTLGLTSMLTLVTTYVNAQKDLPAVSYLKAIDVYMFACIFLVFASLVEFCLANYICRIVKGTIPIKALTLAANAVRPGRKENSGPQQNTSLPKIPYVSPIDKYSRIIFPLIFITFNIIYWSYYLH